MNHISLSGFEAIWIDCVSMAHRGNREAPFMTIRVFYAGGHECEEEDFSNMLSAWKFYQEHEEEPMRVMNYYGGIYIDAWK